MGTGQALGKLLFHRGLLDGFVLAQFPPGSQTAQGVHETLTEQNNHFGNFEKEMRYVMMIPLPK